ncbi:MAG: hypothetical protein ACI3VD_11415 [Candidatus Limivicinus sp.]
MRRYFATFAMLCSIVALAFVKELSLIIRIILLIVAFLGAVDQLREDYKKNHENIRLCKNQSEIEDAMEELVRSQGKICIMSRDLSWVNTDIKKFIEKKGTNIRIFAQEESSLTKELISNGVDVNYYGIYKFEPKTRFTIIRYNRADPQVAIAETSSALKKKMFQHKIYQTGNDSFQDKFICSLSLDLMEICKLASEREMYWQREREKWQNER